MNETGLEMMDSKDRQIAYFPSMESGERRLGLTTEFEIMRGDLVQVLYDASLKQNKELEPLFGKIGGIKYQFGRTITALDQSPDKVHVIFSDGEKGEFDLVVGADGQGSRTRRLAFGEEVSKASFHSWGIHGAYFSMPRIESEGTLARGHIASGRRMIMTRPGGRPVTGCLLFAVDRSGQLNASYKESLESQKKTFAEKFGGLEWQGSRLIEGLKESDDFYAHELGQIKMERLSTGRVVLLGDAGYYPSPFTGLGTNLCLMGSYILAGELAQRSNDIQGALNGYEERMRPVIAENQDISVRFLDLLFPSSRLGVWILEIFMYLGSKLSRVFARFQSAETIDNAIPDYPELNLQD